MFRCVRAIELTSVGVFPLTDYVNLARINNPSLYTTRFSGRLHSREVCEGHSNDIRKLFAYAVAMSMAFLHCCFFL